MEPIDLKSEFDEVAAALPRTEFADYLKNLFDDVTVRNVFYAFQYMGLPAPESRREFYDGTEGGLIFLNRYGAVIRVENADDSVSEFRFDRFNDSAWVLQPLAIIDAGAAVIEICPGCHMEKKDADIYYLDEQLRREMIDFWDKGIRNIGLMPVKTPRFSEGIPVVIDRLAVSRLTQNMVPVRRALKKLGDKVLKRPEGMSEEVREAVEAQEQLYAPLRQAFNEAWPDQSVPADAGKMKQFWDMCSGYVQEGKLVAGWREIDPFNFRDDNTTALLVATKARDYERLLKSIENSVSSAAAATPRSPLQPA